MPSSTAADYIRQKHACCLSPPCEDQSCAIILPTRNTEVTCINGSRYQSHHNTQGKLCDCIIFWSPQDRDIFVPAELKSGSFSATHCLAQLQGGATLAQNLLGAACQGILFDPIIVHKGGIDTGVIKVLRNRRVTFRKQRRLARLIKSGTELARAVA